MGLSDREFSFKVSYFEVYNEEIHDLLQRGSSGRNLKVLRDDPRVGAVIEGLSDRSVRFVHWSCRPCLRTTCNVHRTT